MSIRFAILTLILTLVALPAQGVARPEPSPSLLPRELLFGPAAQALPQLSPDGRRLAWLAPTKDNDSSIWLGDVGSQPLAGKPFASKSSRGIYQYLWAEDGTHILYWQDEEGNENWHLYLLDVATGQTRDLTPYPDARVQNLLLDARHPHEVLVGINKRDHQVFDAYQIDLESGATRLDTTNPGDVLSWRVDNAFHIRAATAFQAATADTIVRARDADGGWQDLLRWPFNDSLMYGQVNGGSVVVGFTPKDTALYAVSNMDSDKSRLVRVDTISKRAQTLAAGDCDVAEDDTGIGIPPNDYRYLILRNPATGAPQAVAFECTERSWKVLDPSIRADMEFLRSHVDGFPYVLSRSRDGELWVVANLAGDEPIEYSLYDRNKKTLQSLFSEHPALARYRLAKPQAVTFKARDGLQISAYLTRPVAPQAGPVPLILYPHGGPWTRDHMDFDPIVQLFASRGYAVLQVEYRGTTGFGKSFLNASNHEFGLKMRDDLIDGVEWSIAQRIADPKRIGVFGISGGGYLALRVTEARPDLFRATADVVGPTDIAFLLESMPPSWRTVKMRWVRRIGDAEHDEALNRKISPHFTGVAAKGAFLVAQGANDPRVNRKHSDAIVSALRQQGATVTYLVYTDEGHGLVRPENNLDFFGRLEEFLATHLAGQAQPWVQEPAAHVEVH